MRLYFKLIVILCIPLLFITIYSLWNGEITCGDFVLRKASIADYFKTKTETQDIYDEVLPVPMPEGYSADEEESPLDDSPQTILMIGDSMLESLKKRLVQYAGENGHELYTVIWYSSSTKIWAQHSDTLRHFINKFQPTYIFICLGSNEMFVKNPEKNSVYVDKIIKQTGDIPFIWIGPPNWKEDTGINAIIEQHVGTNRFFASKRLSYDRISDGAHPTTESAAKWMDSVAVWLNTDARHRIVMRKPQQGTTKASSRTVVLKPL
ncbi:MAG: SGNH/GDSL hydrolase family protein [Tannerella sp.]|jgi:hypothetical protein|nr:SGNH/GDSL hydrolase family protein [Tannerella sp.]